MTKVSLFERVGAKWKEFKETLGIEVEIHDLIRARHTERCGIVIMDKWIKDSLRGESSKPATWKSLIEVMSSSRTFEDVADVLKEFAQRTEGNYILYSEIRTYTKSIIILMHHVRISIQYYVV